MITIFNKYKVFETRELNELIRKTNSLEDVESLIIMRDDETIVDSESICVSILQNNFELFKYLVSLYNFKRYVSNKILKCAINKFFDVFYDTLNFEWLKIILDNEDVNWDETNPYGDTFMEVVENKKKFYVEDIELTGPEYDIFSKLKESYPEKYKKYMINRRKKDFNL